MMQIVDILIGAIAYKLRGFHQMDAKNSIIALIEKRSRYQFDQNALYREDKFNIFHLQLREEL